MKSTARHRRPVAGEDKGALTSGRISLQVTFQIVMHCLIAKSDAKTPAHRRAGSAHFQSLVAVATRTRPPYGGRASAKRTRRVCNFAPSAKECEASSNRIRDADPQSYDFVDRTAGP